LAENIAAPEASGMFAYLNANKKSGSVAKNSACGKNSLNLIG
jgi:hypothetical protein